ncbi:hypothetical protein [Paraburkholderia sp. ZP32-5]|uniref:hypothetical protein n=1 Tax=Paraburkholderia sp. ZP32-5 TaxID=2883245 RepID=UPI001F43B613|nr:hypothetical protein [Paraburkholderia sp. ZP32-5]
MSDTNISAIASGKFKLAGEVDITRLGYGFTFRTLLFFALFSIISAWERRAFCASRRGTPVGSALEAKR